MLIRKLILLVPVILAINAYGNDSAAYYLGLGKGLLDNNQLEISEKYFKKAIHFSTDTATTLNSLNNLGITLDRLGKYDQSIVCYQKADSISHDPETKSSLYINMAIVYRLKGDYNKALAYYNKALGFATSNLIKADLYNNLGLNIKKNRGPLHSSRFLHHIVYGLPCAPLISSFSGSPSGPPPLVCRSSKILNFVPSSTSKFFLCFLIEFRFSE